MCPQPCSKARWLPSGLHCCLVTLFPYPSRTSMYGGDQPLYLPVRPLAHRACCKWAPHPRAHRCGSWWRAGWSPGCPAPSAQNSSRRPRQWYWQSAHRLTKYSTSCHTDGVQVPFTGFSMHPGMVSILLAASQCKAWMLHQSAWSVHGQITTGTPAQHHNCQPGLSAETAPSQAPHLATVEDDHFAVGQHHRIVLHTGACRRQRWGTNTACNVVCKDTWMGQ